jgi:hypothetical protein
VVFVRGSSMVLKNGEWRMRVEVAEIIPGILKLGSQNTRFDLLLQ